MLVQEAGPGRSTRCALAREFQDQRQILMLHEENPFFVKLSRRGPSLIVLRKISGMATWLTIPATNYTSVVRVSRLTIRSKPNEAPLTRRRHPRPALTVLNRATRFGLASRGHSGPNQGRGLGCTDLSPRPPSWSIDEHRDEVDLRRHHRPV